MKVLFGVFDWGLGHATRDLPLIKGLLNEGHQVDIISTGRALQVLKTAFKDKCKYFDVPSVYAPYAKTRFFYTPKFSFYIPKMLIELNKARKLSGKIIKKGHYDRVISDCRYDVYDKPENSFLINHQLKFKSKMFEFATEQYLAGNMKKYGCVIVPDFDRQELTGELSKNKLYLGKVAYIGILSQVKKMKVKEDIDYFFSISGPEPQRTILQKEILRQIKGLKGKIVVALGTPDVKKTGKFKNVEINGYFNPKKQEEIMNRAKCVVSRSGYTTVMELAELEKKNVLFIPTPGQTEQEYLADLYTERGFFNHVHQEELNLKEALNNMKVFSGFSPRWKTEESVKRFLELIR